MKKWLSVVAVILILTGCSPQKTNFVTETDVQNIIQEKEEKLPTPENEAVPETLKSEELLNTEKKVTDSESNVVSEEKDSSEPLEETEGENQQILFTVYDGEDNKIVSEKITYSEGATAFSIIKDHGENVKYRGIKGMEYIYSAYGLEERAQGPMSGWIYTINGKEIMKGASKANLSPGDSLEWRYANTQ